MASPKFILANILTAIGRDARRIKRIGASRVLDSVEALTLTRYASTLDAIIKGSEKEKDKMKQQLNSLDTDKLIEEYKKGDK